jgi:hypothetical protein
VTEAIFGLVGVVIGALLSGVMTYVLERRKEQRLVRASARLLEQELEPFVSPFYELRASFQMNSPDTYERVHGQLDDFTLGKQHREALASALTIDEWYAVMYAYVSLDRFRRLLAGVPFDEAQQRNDLPAAIQSVESDVRTAVGTLGRRGGRPDTDDQSLLRGSRW